MEPIFDQIFKWPSIIQSVIGSALFWSIQILIEYLGKLFLRNLKPFNQKFAKDALIREWIYRKHYSRSGLVNITQGFMLTFDHVFKYLIRGLIFIVFALLISGISQYILGICLVASLYYLFRSLMWISPPLKWSIDDNLHHWKRIAEIEKILMGNVQEDTQTRVEQFSSENATSTTKPSGEK
jgi:hypothetical protein